MVQEVPGWCRRYPDGGTGTGGDAGGRSAAGKVRGRVKVWTNVPLSPSPVFLSCKTGFFLWLLFSPLKEVGWVSVLVFVFKRRF